MKKNVFLISLLIFSFSFAQIRTESLSAQKDLALLKKSINTDMHLATKQIYHHHNGFQKEKDFFPQEIILENQYGVIKKDESLLRSISRTLANNYLNQIFQKNK